MIDPLTEVVSLLEPQPMFAKTVSVAGEWRVQRSEVGQPFYCLVLDGTCALAVNGQPPIRLEAGDFALVPSAYDFTMASLESLANPDVASHPTVLPNGEYRLGRPVGPAEGHFLVGYCTFGSPDTGLLVSLLPQVVHVRGQQRLSMLVQLVVDESRAKRPARDVILTRLLEVMMIEALRSTSGKPNTPGLLAGLGDERLSAAIRRLHESPSHGWTVDQLAKEASLSRSSFYDRFSRTLGVAPMEYLFVLRMALAKRLLRSAEGGNVAAVAERVGYGSASAFSVAFTRHVGVPPARYARQPVTSSA